MTDALARAVTRLEQIAEDRRDISRNARELAQQDWGVPPDSFSQEEAPGTGPERDSHRAYIRATFGDLLQPAASLAADPQIAALPGIRWQGSASEILTDLRRALPADLKTRFDAALSRLKELPSSELLDSLQACTAAEYMVRRQLDLAAEAEARAATQTRRRNRLGGIALVLVSLALVLAWMALTGAFPTVTGDAR